MRPSGEVALGNLEQVLGLGSSPGLEGAQHFGRIVMAKDGSPSNFFSAAPGGAACGYLKQHGEQAPQGDIAASLRGGATAVETSGWIEGKERVGRPVCPVYQSRTLAMPLWGFV